MATTYVNPNAADNTGAGTPAAPKKLIPTTSAPGDRIRILRGTTYTGNEWPTTAGTAEAHIVVEAYANADGSDNAALPRPIINRTAVVSTYSSTNKDYVDVQDLDVRGTVTVANDAAMFYAGQSATFRRVRVDTNVGAFSSWNKSNILVEDCEFNGVSHTDANNNNLVTVSADNTHIDNIRFLRCVYNHKGGGGTNSHVLRAETSSASYDITNLVLDGVTILPPGGATYNPNTAAIGLRLARCPGVKLNDLNIRGVLSGVFVNGGGAIIYDGQITNLQIADCYHFGIHLSGATRRFKMGQGAIWNCGSNMAPSYYGRCIEMSAAAGQGQNGEHEIYKLNIATARNWGGPLDNSTEGCGVGADDGTDSVYMWGCYIHDCEGNGWQQYGGTIGTDTGGHRVTGNVFEDNATASFKNRRTGGTSRTEFNAHCGFFVHKGTPSLVANNVFKGPTLVAISESSNCENILDKVNNIVLNTPYPIVMPASFTRASNNLFHAPNVVMQKYSTPAVDGSGVPTFPALAYVGVGDIEQDPMLDENNALRAGSPAIGTGKYMGDYADYNGEMFKNPPSIGMLESLEEPGFIGGTPTGDSEYGDAASILVPIDITNTEGVLVSITAGGVPLVEDVTPLWNVGTTYALGQRVAMANVHKIYESAKDGNTGKIPTALVNQVNAAGVPTWWNEIGPTNKYAAFDNMISTPMEAASPVVITLSPGAFNGFSLIGVDADTYSVQVLDAPGGDLVYNEPTTALEGSAPSDYYEYFFDRFKPLTRIVRTGIDPYGTAQFKLTLSKASGTVKLGMLAIGDVRPVGIPQRDANVEPQDFSVIKQDPYGATKITRRVNATGMRITAKMDKEEAGAVLDSVKDVLGVPVVVIGSEAQFYEWMTVFGLVSASMSPAEFPYVSINMTVRGMT